MSKAVSEPLLNDYFPSLSITRYAFDKALAYCRIVCAVHKSPVEVYGFLVCPADSDSRVVTDVYLPGGQSVSCAEVDIGPQSVNKAGAAIRALDNKIIGWWHSHNNMHGFHSAKDKRNMKTIVDEVGPYNYIIINDKLPCDVKEKDGKVVLLNKFFKRLYLSSDEPMPVLPSKMLLEIPTSVAWAYSLVYSLKYDHYSAIGFDVHNYLVGEHMRHERPIPLNILAQEYAPLDMKVLCREVMDKTNKRPLLLSKYVPAQKPKKGGLLYAIGSFVMGDDDTLGVKDTKPVHDSLERVVAQPLLSSSADDVGDDDALILIDDDSIDVTNSIETDHIHKEGIE